MKTYWTMKNGKKIDIEEMDENHLKNALKMLIKKEQRKEYKKNNDWYNLPDELENECDASEVDLY